MKRSGFLITILVVVVILAIGITKLADLDMNRNNNVPTYTIDYNDFTVSDNYDFGFYGSLERGEIENEVFSNKYFDISFPMPEELYIYDDLDFATENQFDTQYISSGRDTSVSNYEKASLGNCFDLCFYLPDGMSNVIISYYNTEFVQSSFTHDMESMVKAAETSMTHDQGYGIDEVIRTTEAIGDYEYECLYGEIASLDACQKIYLRKHGKYFIRINIMYYNVSEDIVTEFLDSIHPCSYEFSENEINNIYGFGTSTATDATNSPTDASYVISRGYVDGDTYYNDDINIKIAMMDGMYVFDDQELAEAISLESYVADDGVLTIQDMEDGLSGSSYDMFAFFPDYNSKIAVQYYNQIVANNGVTFPINSYAVSSQSSYENDPAYTNVTLTTETINGYEYQCITAEDATQDFTEKSYMREAGNYVIRISVYYDNTLESEIQSVINSISDIE